MSEEPHRTAMEQQGSEPASDAELAEDEEGGSPFDHPAFLPVLLWALALWFGYDGFLNQDPDMLEHVTFNRVGFGVLVLLGTYYTIQAVRERRAEE